MPKKKKKQEAYDYAFVMATVSMLEENDVYQKVRVVIILGILFSDDFVSGGIGVANNVLAYSIIAMLWNDSGESQREKCIE